MDELKELKSQLAELKKAHDSATKENESLKKANAGYESGLKADLVKFILGVNNTFKAEELGTKSLDDLKLMKETLEKVPKATGKSPAIPIGNATPEQPLFWTLYNKNLADGAYK